MEARIHPDDAYRVETAADGTVATADTFRDAMTAALRLGADEIVVITRRTMRPGVWYMEARYLPTGPGRGWDFGMMSGHADPYGHVRAGLTIAGVPFAAGPKAPR